MIISEFDFCNTHSSPRMYVQHMYDLFVLLVVIFYFAQDGQNDAKWLCDLEIGLIYEENFLEVFQFLKDCKIMLDVS